MRKSLIYVVPVLASVACGGGGSTTTDGGPGNDSGTPPVDGGGPADSSPADTSTPVPDGGFTAGNPDGQCSTAIPAEGQLVDVSKPTAVIGTGTPASCTFAALSTAVSAGGVITFDCGPAPVTIAVTATMNLPINKNTVIDGGHLVTLDGGGSVQILRFDSPNFQATETRVTVQNIRMINGKIAGSDPIPTAPAPCSQGFDSGEGGAIYMRDGNLSVINSIFENDLAAPLGPDVGGGAIRMLGSKHGIVIVGSTFKSNQASNGAGVGCLFSELDVYNSLFDGNVATGHDANNDDATKCSVINNGQHEIGSGGNGGALYSDGANGASIVLCGDKIVNNAAGTNAYGGGVFFTSNDWSGTLTIADTTMTGNTGGHWTSVQQGSVTNAGTAVGTNAKSITITNSTIQGVP
jgi:hypothetical protein